MIAEDALSIVAGMLLASGMRAAIEIIVWVL